MTELAVRLLCLEHMNLVFTNAPRRKAVWGPKRTLLAALVLTIGTAPGALASTPNSAPGKTVSPDAPNSFVKNYKMDDELSMRAEGRDSLGKTKVIVTLVPGAQLPPQFKGFARGAKLDIINGQVLELPNGILKQLAKEPSVYQLHHDRPIEPSNYLTAATVGAKAVQDSLGYTGAGIGIAVIDSGVAAWHDDLTNNTTKLFPYGNQRVAKFVDFVNGRSLPYDDNGHGTHVAGSILGNGYDSNGQKSGVAPGAALVALKVLDQNGVGTISNIIAALNWVVQNGAAYNVRVVNMSVGAGVRESYLTDPLTRAAKAVTDRGITVVAAAGNFGKNAQGQLQWGAITSPGNAPWVLTVGASSTMGTSTRKDDTMASYSSSGPTPVDFRAKPDLVAPGTGTVSLAAPGSTFYATKSAYLLAGKISLGVKPYLALSGTSMATPVVSGTIALMLQANPNLTPNLVKAILQYTAESYPGYSALRQGAGFLNTLGAVQLARHFGGAKVGQVVQFPKSWSKQIIWGNHRLTGGYIMPAANAWGANIVWGNAKTLGATGDNIVWGVGCRDCDNIVWGTAKDGDNIVWGTAKDGDNIVWGTAKDGDNIVWGTTVLGDLSWASSGLDDVMFPDTVQPLPSVSLEFGGSLVVTTSLLTIGGF